MEVIPAIDLRGGRCVRLFRGDFDRETVFDEEPVEVATRWREAGAKRIHIVDLDGARDGVASQREIIGAIARAVDVPVQVGGGIRSLDDAYELIESGVERVIVGTAAIKEPELVSRLIDVFGPQRVIVGIDARSGYVATDGWRETSSTRALELVAGMSQRGVERIVYTDIDRDGTLTAPNFTAISEIVASDVAVIASGGVAQREDLAKLARIEGIEAVIVGRALYTGDVELGPGEWDWSTHARSEGARHDIGE